MFASVPGFLPKSAPKPTGLSSHKDPIIFPKLYFYLIFQHPYHSFYSALHYPPCGLPSPEFLNPFTSQKNPGPPPFPDRSGSPPLFPNAKLRELIPYGEPLASKLPAGRQVQTRR